VCLGVDKQAWHVSQHSHALVCLHGYPQRVFGVCPKLTGTAEWQLERGILENVKRSFAK